MTAQAKRNDLVLGLPKQARLREPFDAVMNQAGLSFISAGKRLDRGTVWDDNGNAIPAYEMKPNDALNRLRERVVDMAVVGYDMLREFNARAGTESAFVYDALPVSPCSMWVAGPAARPVKDWRDLAGLRIATKYENTVRALLEENNVRGATVVPAEGGSEATVDMGIADVVCDMVATGETLKACGLTKQFRVYDGSAVLVRRAGETETQAMKDLRVRLAAAAEDLARPRPRVAPLEQRRVYA